MSTNVLLNEQGTEPLRYDDEFFILKRNDITYRIESRIQYEGEGYLILTSNRLVIIPTKQNANFRAIEIPLNQIYAEEFKQPLFGKNFIKGSCRPFFQSQFGNFNFIIWLKGNRVGTLVGAFFTLIDSLRNNQGRNHNFNIIKCLKENNFNAIFAIDPDDQSFLYQIQPPSANAPKQNFQSMIINRPINRPINYNNVRQNNNNYGNFSKLNEEEIKGNNNVYMSHFDYKKPNEQFVYKDPGFVYKEPINNNINNNISSNNINIPNNKINNSNNINNNFYYINNNINNNNINNNLKKDDDDDDLVSPYEIKKKNDNNNIINNNTFLNNNINNMNNFHYVNNNVNSHQNIPTRIIINYPQSFIQNQQNIQANVNRVDIDLNSPYQRKINNSVNGIIYQGNPQFNQGYPPQNNLINQNQSINNNKQSLQNIQNRQINQVNQVNNHYNQIFGPLNVDNNKEINTFNTFNNRIMDKNKNIGKYRQLREEIPDENDLNSKNQLNNNEFNESNINLENKQDLSLISHKEDSLPDLSNIYPDL